MLSQRISRYRWSTLKQYGKYIILLLLLLFSPKVMSAFTPPDSTPPPPSFLHIDPCDPCPTLAWSDTCITVNMDSASAIDHASSCKYKVFIQRRECNGVKELKIKAIEVTNSCTDATNPQDMLRRLLFGGGVFRSDNPLGFLPTAGQSQNSRIYMPPCWARIRCGTSGKDIYVPCSNQFCCILSMTINNNSSCGLIAYNLERNDQSSGDNCQNKENGLIDTVFTQHYLDSMATHDSLSLPCRTINYAEVVDYYGRTYGFCQWSCPTIDGREYYLQDDKNFVRRRRP